MSLVSDVDTAQMLLALLQLRLFSFDDDDGGGDDAEDKCATDRLSVLQSLPVCTLQRGEVGVCSVTHSLHAIQFDILTNSGKFA